MGVSIMQPDIEASIKNALIKLKKTLVLIRMHNTDYETRYTLILQAVFLARLVGLQTGFRIDLDNSEWPVAFIELPTGQVSWHMPQHPVVWDGHTAEEKYERIKEFING
jgi:hypothetical protein